MKDNATYITEWRIKKFKSRLDYEKGSCYEDSIVIGNVWLNNFINWLLTVIAEGKGGGEQYFDNANSYLGVGQDDTAENASQTDLQGLSTYVAMDTGYPTYGTGQKITFKVTFDETTGNGNWKEFCATNYSHATGTTGYVWNRKVVDKGTKQVGEIWELTLTLLIT